MRVAAAPLHDQSALLPQVLLARSRSSGGLFALKRIYRRGGRDIVVVDHQREVDCLRAAQHDNVVALHAVFDAGGATVLVQVGVNHRHWGSATAARPALWPALHLSGSFVCVNKRSQYTACSQPDLLASST